ncbi:choline kinase family protein [Microbulbifer aggregans]|uniref:choline kinase family protein n=1 Tax=Microbulbifer aggregans TaxID=1769779 RepID=UPI001CFDE382|nr:choline kinase family protein [Microbulbifer aggregans]
MTLSATDIIPEDWSRWSNSKPVPISPLNSGLTNRSFLLASDPGRVVLRWNSPISAELDLNRSAEEQALRLADSDGLCAPLVYCDPEYRYLVTRYIPGEPWNQNDSTALTKFARLLRAIHQLPRIEATLDIEKKIAHYWESISPRSEFQTILQSLRHAVQPHIEKANTLNPGNTLCHNDLLTENLICGDDGRLYAIDWEYAATGDPFYDLAVISDGHALTQDQQRQLLSEYLQRPASQSDCARLAHWQLIYSYLTLLWYAVQHSSGALRTPQIEQEIRSRSRTLTAQLAGAGT